MSEVKLTLEVGGEKTEHKRVAIIDSDGTLVDTTELIVQGYVISMKQHFGLDIQREDVVRAIGGPVKHTYEVLFEAFDLNVEPEQHEKIVEEHDRIQDKIAPDTIKAYEGVTEALEHMKREGFLLAIVTSGSQYQIERNLSAAGINLDLFDTTVTADDELPRKPSPLLVEAVFKKLGLDFDAKNPAAGADVVVIGDHDVDIELGKVVGAHTIGLEHGFGNKIELINAGAEKVVSSWADIDIASIRLTNEEVSNGK